MGAVEDGLLQGLVAQIHLRFTILILGSPAYWVNGEDFDNIGSLHFDRCISIQ